MPSMVRPKGKAKKVAYALLGIPPSFEGKRDKKLRDRMLAQDTWRMR